MRRIVLDTSILIGHWHNSKGRRPLDQFTEPDARIWADRLIQIENTNATLTPVVIGFLGGARDRLELRIARAFLEGFEAVDNGRILKADWGEARRYAERVTPGRRPRDLGDCLIRAVANRLNYEVRTFDTGMPR